MKKGVAELLIGAVYLAIIFSLVRPGAPSAGLIEVITQALVGLVGTVTGYA